MCENWKNSFFDKYSKIPIRNLGDAHKNISFQFSLGQGIRSELTGGGLIRSSGGWSAIKSFRKANLHIKSDERMLGDSDFVERVLMKAAEEFRERQYLLAAKGYDLNKLAVRVAAIYSIDPEEIYRPGKQPVKVKARGLFAYWAVRQLGYTITDLALRLHIHISQPAVSICAQRGERIAAENGFSIFDD